MLHSMRVTLFVFATAVFLDDALAQDSTQETSPVVAEPQETRPSHVKNARVEPTYGNVRYGDHERHVLDFYQAESDSPTPVVIYIHGGGFRGGNKDSISPHTLKQLLDAGISVGAFNYRFVRHAPLPAAHHDCRRALQFVRSKADEWNMDRSRFGAFGGSAGAQICMYLGFHDEMARPDSDDPIERESTRLQAVATTGGQTSMNVKWWTDNIPGYDEPHRNFHESFGVTTEDEYMNRVNDVSALSLISDNDPPIYMRYFMGPEAPVPDGPGARNWKVHHVRFGFALKEAMDALGIEAELAYPSSTNAYQSDAEFFIKKLNPDAHAGDDDQCRSDGKQEPETPHERVTRIFKETSPPIDSPLPDILCFDSEGNEFDLSNLDGPFSVLVFGCLT